MNNEYVIGLDYGTNSVRALIVNVADGAEAGTATWNYAHGTEGVILSRDPNLARQHPEDYLKGAENTIKAALEQAKQNVPDFAPEQVIGIGVDTTGSTPIPVDENGNPLASDARFADNPNAFAWLWKDHTGVDEADAITETRRRRCARNIWPNVAALIRANGFSRKIWHCLKVDETFSMPRIVGSNAPTGFRPC